MLVTLPAKRNITVIANFFMVNVNYVTVFPQARLFKILITHKEKLVKIGCS